MLHPSDLLSLFSAYYCVTLEKWSKVPQMITKVSIFKCVLKNQSWSKAVQIAGRVCTRHTESWTYTVSKNRTSPLAGIRRNSAIEHSHWYGNQFTLSRNISLKWLLIFHPAQLNCFPRQQRNWWDMGADRGSSEAYCALSDQESPTADVDVVWYSRLSRAHLEQGCALRPHATNPARAQQSIHAHSSSGKLKRHRNGQGATGQGRGLMHLQWREKPATI